MIRRILRHMLEIAYDRPLSPCSAAEKMFLSELKTTFRALPELETTNALPTEAEWFSNMNRLRELILNQNPREFLRWDVVTQTMFVSQARYIFTELRYLKHHRDWNTRWRGAIKESSVGHPYPYFLYPASSGNLIHHTYHVAQFEDKTADKINDMEFVFEFGGGYGSMCRLFYKLGFRGKYVIFDLPSFSALQTYYLKTGGFPVLSLSESEKTKTGIVCVSDIDALKSILEEHFQSTHKMFIATWSISETPKTIRDVVLNLVSDFQSFLIGYQDKFGEVDNLTYFSGWKEVVSNVTWNSWRINHLPGNSYLVGARINERQRVA